MNHWSAPTVDSRTGAAHRRRGVPCQDASGRLGFHDADGNPVQVLVVSDGHGGARYVRSDVGSQLACAVALREVERALAPLSVSRDGTLEDWSHWLASVLPGRITALWREEVHRHWQSDAGSDAVGFTPVPYGATLGVLVLTPFWWGHTGLGDWDLVRVDANGDGALLSEEPPLGLRGEATYSLCLDRAERCFVARAAARGLPEGPEPFALLLSSDGLRKSCASDADFLTLARYLVGLSQGEELAAALDHISARGSGDDVSVAVGRWAHATTADAWPEPGHTAAPWIVQPSGPSGDHAAGAREAHGGEGSQAALQKPPVGAAGRRRVPSLLLVRAEGAGGRWLIRSPGRLAGAGVLLVVGLAALATFPRLQSGALGDRRAPAPLVLTAVQQRDLRLQVAALCGPDPRATRQDAALAQAAVGSVSPSPVAAVPPASSAVLPKDGATGRVAPHADRTDRVGAVGAGSPSQAGSSAIPDLPAGDLRRRQRIAATLSSRSSVFQRLATVDRGQVEGLLRQSSVDPLSALIALSATDSTLRPPSRSADRPSPFRAAPGLLSALLPAREATPAAAPSPLAPLGGCLELRQELRAIWRRHPAEGEVRGVGARRLPVRPALPTTAIPPGGSPGTTPAPTVPPTTPPTMAPTVAPSPSPSGARHPAGAAPQVPGGSS